MSRAERTRMKFKDWMEAKAVHRDFKRSAINVDVDDVKFMNEVWKKSNGKIARWEALRYRYTEMPNLNPGDTVIIDGQIVVGVSIDPARIKTKLDNAGYTTNDINKLSKNWTRLVLLIDNQQFGVKDMELQAKNKTIPYSHYRSAGDAEIQNHPTKNIAFVDPELVKAFFNAGGGSRTNKSFADRSKLAVELWDKLFSYGDVHFNRPITINPDKAVRLVSTDLNNWNNLKNEVEQDIWTFVKTKLNSFVNEITPFQQVRLVEYVIKRMKQLSGFPEFKDRNWRFSKIKSFTHIGAMESNLWGDFKSKF